MLQMLRLRLTGVLSQHGWTYFSDGLCRMSLLSVISPALSRDFSLQAAPVSMAWTQMPGNLKSISCGDENTVVGTDASDNVLLFNSGSWAKVPGKTTQMTQVSVGLSGLWGVDKANKLYQW